MTDAAPHALRLRPGLEILRTGPRSFLLRNRQTGTQFVLGAAERFLLHLLERGLSPDDVRGAYEQRLGQSLSERHLEEFVEQLRQLELLAEEPSAAPAPPVAPPEPPVQPVPTPLPTVVPGTWLNRTFDLLVVLFGWLLHPIWILPTLVLVLLACRAAAHHWDRLLHTLRSPAQEYPLWLLLPMLAWQTVFLLSLPRMLLLGIACRKQGGRIRGFGLRFYRRLLPHFACDTGDSLAQLDDRSRRAFLWAGCFWCYLALGSVFLLLWPLARPGSGAGTFWLWMVPPCVVGVLANGIPFFNLGAYWLMCLRRKDPRLRERALAETKAWVTGRTSPEPLAEEERRWLRRYGLGHYLFRFLFDTTVVCLLGYLILDRFKGIGALVFGAGLLWWYNDRLGRVFMTKTGLGFLLRGGGYWPVRWAIRLVLLAGIVALGFVPYNNEIVGTCRVIPLQQHGVRAQLTDEIVKVHVTEGVEVRPGGAIATLSGRTMMENYLATRAELDRAEAQRDLLQSGYRVEEIRIAEQRLKAVQVRVDYYVEQLQREERLLRGNAASRQEYDRYKKEHDSAVEQRLAAEENLLKLKSGYREEEIRAALAAVKLQQERLKYYKQMLELTEVTTLLGGRVVTPHMEEKVGQQVKAGELIAVLQDLSKLRIEVAADDAAAESVREGMRVNVRLHGLYGRLLTGRVARVARTAEQERRIGIDPVRTDPEVYQEQLLNSNRAKTHTSHHLRVYVDLDEYAPELCPGMEGYARIVVAEDDVLWRAVSRPVLRFLRTEVWSWLP